MNISVLSTIKGCNVQFTNVCPFFTLRVIGIFGTSNNEKELSKWIWSALSTTKHAGKRHNAVACQLHLLSNRILYNAHCSQVRNSQPVVLSCSCSFVAAFTCEQRQLLFSVVSY